MSTMAKEPEPKPSTSKAVTKLGHPSTADMVNVAIETLAERGGSSFVAIKKYISANYDFDVEKNAHYIKKYIKSAVASEYLIQVKGIGVTGSFKLAKKPAPKKKSADTKKAPKDPAAAKKSALEEPEDDVPAPAKKSAAPKKEDIKKKPAREKTAVAKETDKSKSPKAKKTTKVPTKPKAPKPKKATPSPKAARTTPITLSQG